MVAETLKTAIPVFRALGETSRVLIVSTLIERGGAATVGELQCALDIPQSSVSRHLRVLLDARLVRVTRSGTQRIYHLDIAEEALTAVEGLTSSVRSCQRTERE